MQVVMDAIKRDGLALARVPPQFEVELNKFGGTEPIEIIKFRVAGMPRDTTSWRVLDVCILAVVQRLESRLRMAESIRRSGPELVYYENTEVNVFRDILITLMRRLWQSFVECKVILLPF
jgi:hypothetical protein